MGQTKGARLQKLTCEFGGVMGTGCIPKSHVIFCSLTRSAGDAAACYAVSATIYPADPGAATGGADLVSITAPVSQIAPAAESFSYDLDGGKREGQAAAPLITLYPKSHVIFCSLTRSV
jgi:hypothetical protein